MSLALEIARRANALDPESFSGTARETAKVAIADMLGCALAGAPESTTALALAGLAVGNVAGGCSVLGASERLRPLDAALVNGTSGHALDFDDTSKSLAGHPTVIIVPAALALAEQQDLTGKDLLDAYIVGVETATRIARGVNFHHYEKGWHPTATLGIFGAAAACGRLLKLDDQALATALSLCVSFASGVKSNFGSQTKPLHAGLAARNGLFAALLASEGFDANPVAFEHPQGFLEVFNGAGNYDAQRMLEGWAAPLDLDGPGISIKKYACVYSVHGAVDAALAIASEHRIEASQIARVTVTMHRRRLLPHVMRKAENPLDAKFSLQYAVARALVDGRVSLEHFEGTAYRDPHVRDAMERIETQAHDDDSNDYGATVSVRLRDGTVLERSVPAPLGRGPEIPLPLPMLRAKFEDCARRSLDAAQVGPLFDRLVTLEAQPSVRDLAISMTSSRAALSAAA